MTAQEPLYPPLLECCRGMWSHKANCPTKQQRQPRWIERMQQGKLPNKDLTGRGPDAA